MTNMWIDKNGELEIEVNGITSSGNVKLTGDNSSGLWVNTGSGEVDFEVEGITAGGRIRLTNDEQSYAQPKQDVQVNTNNKPRKSNMPWSDIEEYLLQGNPSPQRIDAVKNATLKNFDDPRYEKGFTHSELAILYRERAKRTRKSIKLDGLRFILQICTFGLLAGGEGMLIGADFYRASSLDKKYSKIMASQILATHSNGVIKSKKNKMTALLLCVFFGIFGVHRFYVGKIGTGIVYMFSYGAFGIGWIIDIIMILFGKFKDKYDLPLR